MSVRVIVRSRLMYAGQAREPGTVLDVPGLDAWLLTSTTRAELVDQADAQAVRAAVEQHNAQALKETGSSRSAWR